MSFSKCSEPLSELAGSLHRQNSGERTAKRQQEQPWRGGHQGKRWVHPSTLSVITFSFLKAEMNICSTRGSSYSLGSQSSCAINTVPAQPWVPEQGLRISWITAELQSADERALFSQCLEQYMFSVPSYFLLTFHYTMNYHCQLLNMGE